MIPLVTGLTTIKSPCLHTPTRNEIKSSQNHMEGHIQTWIKTEVRFTQLLPRFITPECNRQRRVRASTHQLARSTCMFNVVSKMVKDLDFHSKAFSLDLSGVNWQAGYSRYNFTSMLDSHQVNAASESLLTAAADICAA